MIIITNDASATMHYSEAQWLDAQYATFDAGSRGFRIPGVAARSIVSTLLGAAAVEEETELQYDEDTDTESTVVTQTAVAAVPAMTLADVIAASSEELSITTA